MHVESECASQFKGVICGYRVEELENPLIQKCRYLDKLIGELARGRKMEKTLRVDEWRHSPAGLIR